ncbi:unnamed protein product [Boreogadus saida]
MKKLIKSRSRERGGSEGSLGPVTPPLHAGSCEGLDDPHPHLHAPPDGGSTGGSEGSGGSPSAMPRPPAETLPPQRSITAALKLFPRMRNRLKDRDKVKSLLRRSMSLDGLAGPTGGPGEEGRWGGSLELFEGPQAEEEEEVEEEEEEEEEGKMDLLTSSFSSSVMSLLHHPHYTTTTTTTTTPPPPGHLHPADTAVPDISKLWLTDKDSVDSASGFEDHEDLQHGSGRPLSSELSEGLDGSSDGPRSLVSVSHDESLSSVRTLPPPHILSSLPIGSPGPTAPPSRAHSESSGEFSMSLDNEPWSNGSSPPCRSPGAPPPPNDTSSPRHAHPHSPAVAAVANGSVLLHAYPRDPRSPPPPPPDLWPVRTTKTIRRGSKAKAAARRASDSGGSFKLTKVLNGLGSRASPAKAEPPAPAAAAAAAPAPASAAAPCSPVMVLYVQGKSSSVSGCLNCFSTPLGREGRFRCPKVLPRASSVISTAEGSSRRPSVHSACRAALRAAPEPAAAAAERDAAEHAPPGTPPPPPADRSREPAAAAAADRPHPAGADPAPPLKPPRDPAGPTAGGPEPRPPPSPVQETLFGPPFTFSSVFSNTIFSEAAAAAAAGGGGDPPGPGEGGGAEAELLPSTRSQRSAGRPDPAPFGGH